MASRGNSHPARSQAAASCSPVKREVWAVPHGDWREPPGVRAGPGGAHGRESPRQAARGLRPWSPRTRLGVRMPSVGRGPAGCRWKQSRPCQCLYCFASPARRGPWAAPGPRGRVPSLPPPVPAGEAGLAPGTQQPQGRVKPLRLSSAQGSLVS